MKWKLGYMGDDRGLCNAIRSLSTYYSGIIFEVEF